MTSPNSAASSPPLAAAPALRRPWLLAASLVLVALNLRPALSSVSPVLAVIQAELGLSATAAGLLTTLPVLCLGLFAPLAPRLSERFDAERTVLGVLLVLAAGTALRGWLGAWGLFAGALIAGASIGVIGVLLPGIVKRDFPKHVSLMMGVYTMALCLGAAMAAGATVPLQRMFGNDWRPALAVWGALAVVAALAWAPHLHLAHRQVRPPVGPGLWRNGLAWAVTLYMGLQSSLAYCVFGWLPPILVDRGLDPLQAGLVLSTSVAVQLTTAFSGPWIAMRMGRDQRPTLWLMLGFSLAGLLGCLFAPLAGVWAWAVVLGLGQGGMFSVALLLIVLRAKDAPMAARLSGMSQGVGYTVAALGPFGVGLLHDVTGGWAAVGWFFAAITLAAAAAGAVAGRARVIGA